MTGNRRFRLACTMLIYMALYMICFHYLEQSITKYNIIHVKLDDYIPFCKYFVIPYLLWFPYIFIFSAYFCLSDRPGASNLCAFLIMGMTIFLVVSFLFPNGQNLRPTTFDNDDIFTEMVKKIYASDTPTNILPSIHVLNTLGVQIAICKDEKFKSKKWIFIPSLILSALIIMSTLFIRQHSIVDVLFAFGAAVVMYAFIYREEKVTKPSAQKRRHELISNSDIK